MVAKLAGVAPTDILSEELIRASILQRLNEMGKRDIRAISETVRDYYFSPDQTLKKLGIQESLRSGYDYLRISSGRVGTGLGSALLHS